MSSPGHAGGLVTIFGGGGFLGRHIIRGLAQHGWSVRSASRRPGRTGYLQPMGAVGQIHAVQANLRVPSSIVEAVAGADVVINAVGILAPTGQQSFERVHHEGARAVARAAREAGARRLIHISALGADSQSPSTYARSKAQGETDVLHDFPEASIVRPSIVFGPEDAFFNRFAGISRFSPFLPLIGGGRTRFQPVYVGDVAQAVTALLAGHGQAGKIYELGGPEILTFRDLLERTLTYVGRKRLLLTLPFWAAKFLAVSSSFLPTGLRPITLDQVRLLEKDNVVSAGAISEGRTLKGLGIDSPQSMETIVPLYLERFHSKGQYAHYRR